MKIAYYTANGFYIYFTKAEINSIQYLGPYTLTLKRDKLCLERSTTGAKIHEKNGRYYLISKTATFGEAFGATACEYQLATSFKGIVVTLPSVRNEVGEFVPVTKSSVAVAPPPGMDSIASILRELHARTKDESVEFKIEGGFPVIYRPARQRISVEGTSFV